MRTAILIAWGIIALLGIAACSGGPAKPLAGASGSPQPSSSGLFSGTVRAPDTSASAGHTASPGHSASPGPSASPTAAAATPTPAPRPSRTRSFPTAAPVTGGGGTAGFEHGGLLALGLFCVVAGGAAFTIRRRLNRGG